MRVRLAIAAVLVAVLGAGCGSGGSHHDKADPAASTHDQHDGGTRYASYAALGDSYTSAPLVPVTDVNSACLRSNQNYPTLLAHALGVRHFRDVSCGGAQTKDLIGSQKGQTPQLDALDKSTDLATISIGGNDIGAIGVILYECPQLRSRDPQGSPCRDQTSAWVHAAITTVQGRVRRVLTDARHRAPNARIIAIDYPQVVGSRSCPLLPLASGDIAYVHGINHDLDRAIMAAARAAHVQRLDLWGPSKGHDVCSAHPWINGRKTQLGKAAALHPFGVEQKAVARLLEKKLSHS